MSGIELLIDEIRELRKDLHWLLQNQAASQPRIYNHEGCCCEHFRNLKQDAWSCPLHGYIQCNCKDQEPGTEQWECLAHGEIVKDGVWKD